MNDSIINTDVRFYIVGNRAFLGSGSHITDCILRNDLNLTEVINLHSVLLQKTHRIDIEFFGKMKISKIK
jgi:ADP-glucose pyrophosphorylase